MNKAKQILLQNFDQMVEVLQKTICFNTEKDAPVQNGPFGLEIKKCLEYVLQASKDMGFETVNCDGYAGHVDFVGKGDQVLGILGHLDVVPSKAEEWLYPPYGGEIHDGKLFGRGTMDDKGPMIACLFAAKALKDAGFEPDKTIRLIFGCDEESGMECMRHYFTKMPYPNIAFSPDGDFPVINREKGIFQFALSCGKLPQGVTITAGERANVVPSLCTVTSPKQLQVVGNVTEKCENGIFTYTSLGKSAHGSTPNEGVNAIHPLLAMLAKAYPENATLAFLSNKCCDTTGGDWGINLWDSESGNLTCSLDIIRTDESGNVTITVDIRFPVSYTCEHMQKLIEANCPDFCQLLGAHASEPLFVASDTYLVTTLMDVYNKATNENASPIAIGGGTYSRCLPNCVAFGPLFPGEEQTIHMQNECIDLESLKKMALLYLEAIYLLTKD